MGGQILYIVQEVLVPHGSNLHMPCTNYHLLAAQQEPYSRA